MQGTVIGTIDNIIEKNIFFHEESIIIYVGRNR